MNPGRLILPPLRWKPETAYRHEEKNITQYLKVGVGGFIIFGSLGASAGEVKELVATLKRRAQRPLVIAADLERGAGQQMLDLTEFPPPGALASLEDPTVIAAAAGTTATEARSVGINWILGPVCDLDIEPDNPIIQTRSFGAEATQVAADVRQWVEACHAAGVPCCAKHYPGHGRTTTDSHSGLPVVETDKETLQGQDGLPFAAAVKAGVEGVMTAHVSYTALDPSGRPATFSKVILDDLRQRLGFNGPVVTDALIMEGALEGHSESQGSVQALKAGCDLLLYPKDPAAVSHALAQAVKSGVLASQRMNEALGRYSKLLTRANQSFSGAPSRAITATAIADRLLDRGLLRGTAPKLSRKLELAVVDDDIYGAFAPGPSDFAERALRADGFVLEPGGDRVVLAFAEPRAAKGRAGFGPESLAALNRVVPGAALVIMFAHPRLLPQIPGDAPVLVAWHRQRLMQEAAARWVKSRTED